MIKKSRTFLSSPSFIFAFVIILFLTPCFLNSRKIDVHAQTPIEISTLEDLYAIRDNLGGDYILMNNLDFQKDSDYEDIGNKTIWTTGEGWIPIGFDSGTMFTGSFDGRGYEIRNLFINRPTSNQGLFGVSSGTIQNLRITNVSITGSVQIGGLIGYNREGTVSNSSSSGTIIGESATGGLIGYNYEGTISDSSSSANVTGTQDNTGGLIGYNSGGTISNSSSTANVTGTQDNTGGLIGYNNSSGTVSSSYSTGPVNGYSSVGGLVGTSNGAITNCYSSSTIIGTSNWVGGLVGDISDSAGSIENSYSTGSVRGPNLVGGIVSANNGITTNSFWDVQTSGIDISDGGTGKTTAEMKSLSTFNDTWDILGISSFDPGNPSIWYINDGSDYPRLFWQYSPPPEDPEPPTEITLPTPEDPEPPTGITLPKTNIFKNKVIIIAGLLIQFLGFVIYNTPNLETMRKRIEIEKRKKFERRF